MPFDQYSSKQDLQRMFRTITDQSSMKFVVDPRCELAQKEWLHSGRLSGGLLGKKRSMESLDDSDNEEVAAFHERQRSMTPQGSRQIHLPRIHELDAVKRHGPRQFYTPEPSPHPSPVPPPRRSRSYPPKGSRPHKNSLKRVQSEDKRIPLWDLFAAIDLDTMMTSQAPIIQVQREASPSSVRMMTPPRTPEVDLSGFLSPKAGSRSPRETTPNPATNNNRLPFIPHKAHFTYTDTRALMNHFAFAKKRTAMA